MKIKKLVRRLFKLYWMILVPFLICCGLLYFFILKDLPSPTKLSSNTIPQSSKIYDRNSTLLYTVYADRNQTFIPLQDIPTSVQKATIAIEDKDFYHHGAIDLRGIARAAVSTLFHKQVQGGSTLTQQLVKTTLLSPERTIQRKIKEVILAFVTEMLYSKDRVLEMYLNQVPYGGTSYGIESAAQTYFGKKAKTLDLAEAALLAGLPEAPSTYSPFGAYPELGKKRQETILQKMYEQGYISKADRDKALKEQLRFQKIKNVIKAPHFVLYVKDLLEQKYGKKAVSEGGLSVTTSLDLPTQDYAQASVSAEVAGLKGYHVSNGAALVTNPGTGEILAMVGSRGYFSEETDGNVNITLQHLQPGSSIKPINYAVGLLKGYTAATPFIDERLCFSSGPKPYCPVNYDGKFHGAVQMRYALGNSFNVPAVEMLKLNGLESMIATASAMGITTFDRNPDNYGLSLTLGGGEVRMIDMAVAFGVFANGGYRIDLHPILKVTDKNGKILEEYTPPASPIFGKKVLPSGVAFIISNILADNGARLEEFGPNSALHIANKPVSAKTGTTNDFRDNWTIGYTPQVLVATWVGNNDHTPMNGLASGITGAAPIWHDIMSHLLDGVTVPLLLPPSSVIEKFVCAPSGLIPPPDGTPDRCQTRKEFFLKGTEPKLLDKGRQSVLIDKATNDLAKPGQTDNVEMRDEVVVSDPLNNKFCLSCPHPVPSPTPAP